MSVIILRNSLTDYFFPYIHDELPIYEVEPVRKKLVGAILVRLKRIFHCDAILYGKWKRLIKKRDTVIVFDVGWSKDVTAYIKRKNKNCRLILYFYNPIADKDTPAHPSMLEDKNVDEFWTYNKNDVEKYHIHYNPTFYTEKMLDHIDKSIDKSHDIVYIGRHKGRDAELQKFVLCTRDKGIDFQCIVVEDDAPIVPYGQYLGYAENAKAILELTAHQQKGNSLRALEALFLKRKLVTNNVEVMNEAFYHPNNIFVIGKDDLELLKDFLNSPMIEISSEVKKEYLSSAWLKRFG